MKICVVGSVFPRSHDDAEVPWLRTTLRMLTERGYDISVYVPSFRGRTTHTIDGIPVHRFRYFFAPWETLTHDEGAPNKIHRWYYKIITLFYLCAGTIGLIRLHRRVHFDVLHVHWPAPHALFGYAAALLTPAKVVLNFHGASIHLCHRYPWLRRFLRAAIARADRVIVNSSFTSEQVKRIYHRQVDIIAYGTTIVPKDTHVNSRRPRSVLAVGRLIERKGFVYLIEAIDRLRATFPDVHCTIAGGGPLYHELERKAESLHLGDILRLAGRVSNEELAQLYATSAAFVLPAIEDRHGDTEGLGVVLIEALTWRIPVIGTQVGGIPDIVIDDHTGKLVPQKDPDALASALQYCFENPQHASQLAAQGFSHIQSHFSWDAIMQKLEQFYGELSEPRGYAQAYASEH